MAFVTGIAAAQLDSDRTVVATATWNASGRPRIPVQLPSLHHYRRILHSTTIIQGADIVSAVNTACHRTFEKLYIRRLIVPPDIPAMFLITNGKLADNHYILPVRRTSSHWIMNTAGNILNAWLRGER